MSEDKLDREIDRALQEIVAGDGPADLRRRVLSRLDERPRPVVARRAMLAAAAVMAVAAGTVALLRGPEVHAPEAPIARREVTPVTPTTLPSPLTAPVPAARRPVRPTSRRVAQRPPAEILIANEPNADVVPIAEPIEPAPLDLAPMQAEALIIAPLRVDAMEIVPLAEPRSE
jgi:hypothetical protein